MKYIQNQLLEFIVSLPVSEKSAENAELYQSVIAILDSCKTIKDVQNHIEDWQRSSSDNLQKDYESTREMVLRFYSAILHLYQRFDSKKALMDTQNILDELQKENDEYLALTKGDNNPVNDRGLYEKGDLWLNKKHILGRIRMFCPYVGIATILLNDYPMLKWAVLIIMGIIIFILGMAFAINRLF